MNAVAPNSVGDNIVGSSQGCLLGLVDGLCTVAHRPPLKLRVSFNPRTSLTERERALMPPTMSTLLPTRQGDFPRLFWIELGPHGMPLTYAEHMHSEANVRLWSSYLPADCVNTMIAMGWDLST